VVRCEMLLVVYLYFMWGVIWWLVGGPCCVIFSGLKVWCQTRTRRAHRAQSLTHRPSFNGSERPRARDALIESSRRRLR
jgi:hypothetical protein